MRISCPALRLGVTHSPTMITLHTGSSVRAHILALTTTSGTIVTTSLAPIAPHGPLVAGMEYDLPSLRLRWAVGHHVAHLLTGVVDACILMHSFP